MTGDLISHPQQLFQRLKPFFQPSLTPIKQHLSARAEQTSHSNLVTIITYHNLIINSTMQDSILQITVSTKQQTLLLNRELSSLGSQQHSKADNSSSSPLASHREVNSYGDQQPNIFIVSCNLVDVHLHKTFEIFYFKQDYRSQLDQTRCLKSRYSYWSDAELTNQ